MEIKLNCLRFQLIQRFFGFWQVDLKIGAANID